jgi:hypothetical protein
MENTIELWNLILTIVNLLVFVFFTKLIYDYNKHKDQIDFLRQVPLISIEQNDNHSYFIRNVGSGPALNIRILSKPNFEDKVWELNEIGFSLFGNSSEIELNSFDKSAYLILYNDIHKKDYFSFMIDNKLEYGSITDAKQKDNIKKVLKFSRAKEQLREEHAPSI